MKPMKTKTSTKETVLQKGNDQEKQIAIIAYITLIGLVVALVMNREKKSPFARYHIRQSLGLAATGLALAVVGVIPILGWIINLLGVFVLLYMWVRGLMHAINKKEQPVPFLGRNYEKWLKNV